MNLLLLEAKNVQDLVEVERLIAAKGLSVSVSYPGPSSFPLGTATHLVGKWGNEYAIVLLRDVIYFFSENKVTYALTIQGKKFMMMKSLADLHALLPKHTFFRANRQCLISLCFIQSFKPVERSRIQVCLQARLPNTTSVEIIVSQENAAAYKQWIGL